MKKNGQREDHSLFEVINLLSNLVVFNNYDFNGFLKELIAVVTKVIPVDSCFIYFYDRQKKKSILIGSKKPHKHELGNIVLEKDEGITGWVAQHKQTVAIEKQAFKDKRFKYFRELPEDKFESFLSVPILDEEGVVGVINLQHKTPYTFSKKQIRTIESLVKIIASGFVNVVLARKIDHLENKLEERKLVEKAKGLLMKIRKLNEDQAYRFMQKEAMEKRKSMREIGEAIVLVLDNSKNLTP